MIFFDNDTGIIFSLSLTHKKDNTWGYGFQEEGLNFGYHYVSHGKFKLDLINRKVISQKLHDKYGDMFHPNFGYMMNVYFEDIDPEGNYPDPVIY